ncbi:hypothetical protein FAI41_05325 [Acetobacteraceae bacterium]|nr:hypothetical protein FAI41_05325 [Acetobacteraceae bacterium]
MDHFCDNLREGNSTFCCGKKFCHVKFCQCCCAFCCCLVLCRGRAFAAQHISINWTEEAGENIQEHVHVRGERNKKDVPLEQSGVKADYLNKRADLGPLGRELSVMGGNMAESAGAEYRRFKNE